MEAVAIPADQLDQFAARWDAAMDSTEQIDPFCTSSLWSFAAAASFPDVSPPVVVSDGTAYVGMRATSADDGTRLLVGLDPVWGFATPLVGDPRAVPALLVARLGLDEHDLAVVTGQRDASPVTGHVLQALQSRFRLLRGPVERRLRADVSGGFDAWCARRPARFRQHLRRVERRCSEAGITVEDVSAMAPRQLMARVSAIEQRSWKGPATTGLASEQLAAFYERVVWRLAAREQVRLFVATRDGVDVGYVLGGVRDRTYRGLQLSYGEQVKAFGVGHLLQLAQLRALEGTGIDVYDMGMDMPYKHRWADRVDETYAIVIAR